MSRRTGPFSRDSRRRNRGTPPRDKGAPTQGTKGHRPQNRTGTNPRTGFSGTLRGTFVQRPAPQVVGGFFACCLSEVDGTGTSSETAYCTSVSRFFLETPLKGIGTDISTTDQRGGSSICTKKVRHRALRWCDQVFLECSFPDGLPSFTVNEPRCGPRATSRHHKLGAASQSSPIFACQVV